MATRRCSTPSGRGGRCGAALRFPGEQLVPIALRRGDLLIRVARGEGWSSIGVVGTPRLYPHDRLSSLGLRFEGYPPLEPGAYVHLVEPGPPFRGLAARFARRLCDATGITLPDTLLLRIRPQRQTAAREQVLVDGGSRRVRSGLPAGGEGIRTCMGLFLSSSRFWFVAGSLFGAGKPFFVPSPAIRFAERAEGVKGPKR